MRIVVNAVKGSSERNSEVQMNHPMIDLCQEIHEQSKHLDRLEEQGEDVSQRRIQLSQEARRIGKIL